MRCLCRPWSRQQLLQKARARKPLGGRATLQRLVLTQRQQSGAWAPGVTLAATAAPHREPLSYKEFILQLPDEVTPEDAQCEFQAYLAEYWGSQVRAEFEAKRNEDWCARGPAPRAPAPGRPPACAPSLLLEGRARRAGQRQSSS